MKKIVFKLSFIGLLFLTTINTTTPSDKMNIVDQTSEQSDLTLTKNKSFFDLSINEIWKTKLKPVLQDQKLIVKLLVFFGSVCLMDEILKIVRIAQNMQCDNDTWNRIYLYNSLKFNSFFKVVAPLAFYAGFAFADLAFYITKKIA